MGFTHIAFEQKESLGILALDRVSKYNALSRSMILEIIDALNEIKENRDLRVVILKANGKHFCTGHDLGELAGASTAVHREIFDRCSHMMEMLHDLPQPVIAQVQGVATAAGCQLVAASDLVVAEEGASFATPGVRIGLFCSTPMVPLCRAVGRKRALEMLLTGRSVSAAEAAQWGLVNLVVPVERLEEETENMARTIVQASSMAVGIGKQAFYGQVDLAEAGAYDLARATMVMNLATRDAREGIEAFLEKRKPVWKGE